MRRAATPAAATSRLRGVRVLIVEDHEGSLQTLREIVETFGATTVLARTGEEALERVREGPPDVILLDLLLPALDGFAVAERFKAEPATAGIPIVAVTGLDEAWAIRQTWATGFAAHLAKPVSMDDVCLAITRVVEARPAR